MGAHDQRGAVTISDQLSDEEQAIMVFLKRYFEAARMSNALWILNEREYLGTFEQFSMATVSYIGRTEGIDSMARYLARACPRCIGYVGIVIRQPGRNVPLQAVNGRCTRCAYRLALIVIRSKAQKENSQKNSRAESKFLDPLPKNTSKRE
jgi:hypothetical protein